jgi:cytochrome P450
LKLAGVSFFGMVLLYLGKIWHAYGHFKRLGIKSVKTHFLTGNLTELRKNGFAKSFSAWSKQLDSKTYGYFEGHTPILVTTDLDLIQEIFIKRFSNFSFRKRFPINYTDNGDRLNLVSSGAGKWKRFRSLIAPAFTPAKLKDVLPSMKEITQRFLKKIEENQRKDFSISLNVKLMTQDIIGNCVVGLTCDVQNNGEGEFFEHVEESLKQSSRVSTLFRFFIYFPEIKPITVPVSQLVTGLFAKLGLEVGPSAFWLLNNLGKIISERVEENVSRLFF